MQRMLVGLVVFLTLIVAMLVVVTFELRDQVETFSKSRPAATVSRSGPAEGMDAEDYARLERRVEAMLAEIDRLRREQRSTAVALAKGAARAPETEKESAEDGRIPDPRLENATRRAGEISVTEADEAFYIAVKESVDRKRRITGLLANTMRRVDRLATSGAIQPISDANRPKVEEALLKYAAASDDLVTRYYRNPTEQLKALPADQKRDAMRQERETILVQAQQDLSVVLGAADAATLAEKTLKARSRMRPGTGVGLDGRRSRGRRDR